MVTCVYGVVVALPAMANPRKFSEKIALLQQKQAEETAAFEKIMREVSDATSKVMMILSKHYFCGIATQIGNIHVRLL